MEVGDGCAGDGWSRDGVKFGTAGRSGLLAGCSGFAVAVKQ